ncbi:hypothetical protein Rsub_07673 [Raphidocelis subcapitata]|uniref:Uncharacterized protein n=1 Tax=Raphidocelis subcapitata TaxID=307507 RepID=A0A2V0P685_9CHLO|nr:hypothetical protein Rsub_07673 [Raphidocelis subcapitata]|eukprot:GBF95089.1 hypothetical protein Rsub_07673 [Raphidocelis subcapitata]
MLAAARKPAGVLGGSSPLLRRVVPLGGARLAAPVPAAHQGRRGCLNGRRAAGVAPSGAPGREGPGAYLGGGAPPATAEPAILGFTAGRVFPAGQEPREGPPSWGNRWAAAPDGRRMAWAHVFSPRSSRAAAHVITCRFTTLFRLFDELQALAAEMRAQNDVPRCEEAWETIRGSFLA